MVAVPIHTQENEVKAGRFSAPSHLDLAADDGPHPEVVAGTRETDGTAEIEDVRER